MNGFKHGKPGYLYLRENYFQMQRISALLIVLFISLGLSAQTCTVAVAANAYEVVQVLAERFQAAQHLQLRLVSSASGTLAAQIRNGAPFSLFLSADTSYPNQLYRQGLGLHLPVVYARGKLILGSTVLKDIPTWKKYLDLHPDARIALATPAGAPYGKAAVEYLQSEKLAENIKSRLVYGTSIAQVNTYILTGAVVMGFSSRSFIETCRLRHQAIYWMEADSQRYTPVLQGMVLLKQGSAEEKNVAEKFYHYLLSREAIALFKAYGYGR